MDPFELNCTSREDIVQWIILPDCPFPVRSPRLLGSDRIPDYPNAWHFAGKQITDGKIVRIFRPGPYTILNPDYAIAVSEENGIVTFSIDTLADTDSKYGTECRTAKN